MRSRVDLDDARFGVALQHLASFGRQGALPVMQRISRYMLTSTQLRFKAQQGPDGQAWWPSRRAAEESGQTLRDSGRLFRSLTRRAGADYAEAGTNVAYAAAHQFGVRKVINVRAHRRMRTKSQGERGTVSVTSSPVKAHARLMFLPIRAFVGFSRSDQDRIVQLLRDGIAQLASK
jgi:phage virion morphogenesis protein